MFSASAALYDSIYSQLKDYHEESAAIASRIRSIATEARTVLDVGCGTGEHARLLSENHGFTVDGIDLDAGLLALAQAKNPKGRFTQADMITFDLGRRYDIVTCLFSSIGYVRTLENLRSALLCFHNHLYDRGLVIVEPWFAPGVLKHGNVRVHTAETDTLSVCRMSHVSVQDRLSTLRFEYLIGGADGIRHATETHDLGLFSVEETLMCFADAGLVAEYDPVGIAGRGLYIGRIAP